MRLAGYPYKPNDLTPEQWEDLGSVEELMRHRERQADLNALQVILRNALKG